ncbi:winged helix-turn-helix domain-containing protein [Oxyplasma meridianum]|uniref:Winged helix-turn-helix domain-containing protein n=1 Tax=Oxyplasma meridianum TaxID=3073602 RepID=A0AAX4NE42_9ARCH
MVENREEIRKKLIKSFKNETKLSIIIILFQKGKLTATQMSKIIGKSRSNLYQNLKEMVEEGILAEPESKVRKNFVEKYYYPNTEIFESFDPEDMKKELIKETPENLKGYLLSSLNSQILRLRLIAGEIEMMSEKDAIKLRDIYFQGHILFSNSWVSKETYEKVLKHLREVVNKMIDEEDTKNSRHMEDDTYNLILIAIPRL